MQINNHSSSQTKIINRLQMGDRTTCVWQKWGFCAKFEHWNSIEHLY